MLPGRYTVSKSGPKGRRGGRKAKGHQRSDSELHMIEWILSINEICSMFNVQFKRKEGGQGNVNSKIGFHFAFSFLI